MMFQFNNIHHFIAMDGHGVYVWTAVFVSLMAMLVLVLKPVLSRRAVIAEIGLEVKREGADNSDFSESG